MELRLDPQQEQHKVQPGQTESYMLFRSAIPKPSEEDTHLRHILRFYITRAMQKRGEEDIYVIPKIAIGNNPIKADVLSGKAGSHILAICEPGSVTSETEETLMALKDVDGLETIVVHSQYGNPGNVMEKFKPELESKKFRLLAVVPPPFDDVYEYDIWMFETTFRDLFAGD